MNRIQYFSILLAFVISFNASISAKTVDINTAKTVAKNFFYESSSLQSKANYNSINISESIAVTSKSVNIYYIFNFTDNGFVIVSADDAVYPIIGYSLDNNFKSENQPDNLNNWMERYKKQITNAIASKVVANEDVNKQWQHYLTKPELSNNNKTTVVLPLLSSTWDQELYYNSLCPANTAGPGGHDLTGCVATAAAQIMYYYRYPLTGQGTYTDIYNSSLTVNCGATNYDWNGMLDNLSAMNIPVATLMYHAGVTANMTYTPAYSGTSDYFAGLALKNNFKYQNVTFTHRDYNDNPGWISLLKTELDAKRPILYGGDDSLGNSGHAFVCDGYDVNGKFHFNWGWSGSSNGYFDINNLNPAGENFTFADDALTNIYPANGYPYYCSGTTTITTPTGTLEDGSGPNDYQNNNDCRWLIKPDRAITIHFRFTKFSTEPTNDQVIIYDGATTSDPVLGTFSGTTIPATVNSTGGQMLIRFITNSSITSTGWRAYYYSSVSPMCPNLTNLTAPNGTFSDGSGSSPYNYSTYCDWKIAPPGATNITLGFTSFNLSSSDKLKIYDVSHSPSVLLDTYSGTSLPATKTYNVGQIAVIFTSTSLTNGQGWDAFYSSQPTDINNLKSTNNIIIYPNPTNNILYLTNADNSNVTIYNLLGESVYNAISAKSDKFTIDISNIPQGTYIIKIINDKEITTKKIIINR